MPSISLLRPFCLMLPGTRYDLRSIDPRNAGQQHPLRVGDRLGAMGAPGDLHAARARGPTSPRPAHL